LIFSQGKHIYVFNGIAENDEKLFNIWTFSIEKMTWTLADLPVHIEKRSGHTAHYYANKIFLMMGEKMNEISSEVLICQHPGMKLPRSFTCLERLEPPSENSEESLEKRLRKKTIVEITQISEPFNMVHKSHVDDEYQWSGENVRKQFKFSLKFQPSEVFELEAKLGEG
jgi:hypothetical protein